MRTSLPVLLAVAHAFVPARMALPASWELSKHALGLFWAEDCLQAPPLDGATDFPLRSLLPLKPQLTAGGGEHMH